MSDAVERGLHPVTVGDDSAIMARLDRLEQGLTNGFAVLESKLNNALLDQERRNSSFATRDRMDEIARKLDAITQAALVPRVEALEKLSSTRTLDTLKSATGFMASLLGMILTGLVTYMLTHGLH